MGRHCFWVALIVYLIVSFVPALALTNLLGGVMGGRKRAAG